MSSQDSLQEWRPELLEYHKEMYDFQNSREPREILEKLSGFSARASWMRYLCIRSTKQDYVRFRIDELDPFLDQVKEQFKIWSRYQQVIKDEYEMSRGQF